MRSRRASCVQEGSVTGLDRLDAASGERQMMPHVQVLISPAAHELIGRALLAQLPTPELEESIVVEGDVT